MQYGGLSLTDLRELRQVREENSKLNRRVADLTLDRHVLQEIVKKRPKRVGGFSVKQCEYLAYHRECLFEKARLPGQGHRKPREESVVTDLIDDDLSHLSSEQRRALAQERWESLPTVVREIFANAPKLAMYEVLRRMGVAAEATRGVEWAYVAVDDSLVVTVWHDQIRSELDGSLRYVIPPSKWRRDGVQAGRADRMKDLLESSVGGKVKVMLLRHQWDKNGTQFAKPVAADLRRWTVDKASDDVFVLRR